MNPSKYFSKRVLAASSADSPIPHGVSSHARVESKVSIARTIELEGANLPLAYVYHKKEHWFVLDQLVRLIEPMMKMENGLPFCCVRACKLYILSISLFWNISPTKNSIIITECRDPHVLNEVNDMMRDQVIETEHEDKDCMSMSECGARKAESEFYVSRKKGRLNQWNSRLDTLDMIYLIDFQSLYALCQLTKKKTHGFVSLLLAFSQMCTARGACRSALTKRDKEKIAAKQKWECAECEERFGPEARYEIDHAVPLSIGGRTGSSNLWALCGTCHAKKSEREASYPMHPIV